MPIRLLLSFLICLSLNVYSQKENVSLKFCPLCLVDEVSFPTVQSGIEFSFSEKLTWYNEFGFKYRKSYYETADPDTNFIKSAGFKVKTEFRYYTLPGKRKRFTGEYVAVNAFFIKDDHNTEIDYYYQRDSSLIKSDAFGVEKKVFGINVLYECQKAITNTIAIDFYFGIGARFRNVSAVNREYDSNRDGFKGPIDVNIYASKQMIEAKGGRSMGANITMGLRLCFSL